jgi:hypothetical protein
MDNDSLAHINKAWESSCKVMLGESIGPIGDYEDYLWKNVERCHPVKSAISGKEVAITGDYAKGAKFISGDEMGEYSKILGSGKLGINDLKDIDSILGAIGERIHYSGNDILGNSGMVAHSNRVVDSTFVYKAHDVFYSKYVAYTYLSKYSEYIFGCESVGKGTHFAIKAFETYDDSRLFECVRVYESADIVYAANLENCQSCLFCFNLRSKRRCIGNNELPEGEFAKLKEKLLEDVRGTLKAKKNAPSIMEIVGGMP